MHVPGLRRRFLCALAVASLVLLADRSAAAQGSQHALRFHGASLPQQDRVRIPIDDDRPGADASTPLDVGAGDFTLEFWVRGTHADNGTAHAGGDVEHAAAAWRSGNLVVDRGLAGSANEFGVSIAGGYVRFGTGRGDALPQDAEHTLEGDVDVLDGAWHHVACTRERTAGVKRIFVDGRLDVESAAGASRADLSYPDGGVQAPAAPWNAFLVLGAEKHDAGPPAFTGFLDEFRAFAVARSESQVFGSHARVLPPGTPGLVAAYRFEEGSGTALADVSGAGGAPGALVAGVPGNGAWTAYANGADQTAPVAAGPVPPGFRIVTVATGFTEPTALGVAGDGRVFVGQRDGKVRLVQSGALVPAPVLQVAVDGSNAERGLLGMALHPHFDQNGWLYVFYTTSEPRDRVSRFRVTGATADPASEQVVWQSEHPAPAFHHGGGIRLSPLHPHALYIGVGDQLTSGNAQDLSTTGGKILRVGDDGAIPADNPFVGIAGARPEVWAAGVRNPFRLAIDAATGEVWIGDVGGNVLTSAEELNRGAPGVNFGWPWQEGAACHVADCSPYAAPAWTYRHDDPAYHFLAPQGSITAGPVVRGGGWPAGFEGDLLVGDYSNRNIRRLMREGGPDVVLDPELVAAPFAGTVVDLAAGPDGLYWVTYGHPGPAGIPDAPALYRLEYSATGNVPPVAVASGGPLAGAAPLAVQFSSAGTFDPDGAPAPLQPAWDFGDGSGSSQPHPSHVFPQNGRYTVVFTAGDGADTVAAAALEVRVGTPPVPVVTAPIAGAAYGAGESIPFQGSAIDAEDGPLGSGTFSWRVLLHHHDHVHPYAGPFNGVTSGSFMVEAAGHAPDDTWLELLLTVTDADGLDATTSVPLAPRLVPLAFGAIPSGVPLRLDGEPLATPVVLDGLAGYQHLLEAPAAFVLDGTPLAFQCWSDGQPRAHVVVTPDEALQVTALYQPVATTTLAAAVPGPFRNAQHTASQGQQPGHPNDPFVLGVGRDLNDTLQAGLAFQLPVPPGATLLAAKLRVTATSAQAGLPLVAIASYDVPAAPPFAFGSPAPLVTFAPLTGTTVAWLMPPFVPGQLVESPDLVTLLQPVIDRPDWQAGNHVGLVIDGTSTIGTQFRTFRNFASGQPPVLEVKWALLPASGGACPLPCGFTTYGPGAGPVHTLHLVATGAAEPGGMATFHTSGLGDASLVYTFAGDGPAALNLQGGTLLVDPFGFFAFFSVPVVDGVATWSAPILDQPAFAGFQLHLQSAAVDPAQPFGVVFSNGLRMTVCSG